MSEAIYQHYFGLNDAPFSITPDPRFVYLSPRHEDALAHLRYGIGQGGGGGFVQLTGEVGTGKTTLCRLLIEQLPDDTRVALILNPKLEPVELLEAICDEFRLSTRGIKGSQKGLVDKLNAFLLKAHADGLTAVLIIDEAQNLSPDALEQVRLLTNLETATQKLLQIVFLGQPELRDLLARSDLRQLAQRITARYHLGPLNQNETAAYVAHRMKVAGATVAPFAGSGLKALYQTSGGVPRLINVIAERSLLAAYARDRRRIDARTVRQAADEVLGVSKHRTPAFRWLAAAALLVFIAAVASQWPDPTGEVIATVQTAPQPAAPIAVATPEPQPELVVESSAIEPSPIEPPPTIELPLPSEAFDSAWQRLFEQRELGQATDNENGPCPLQLAIALFCLEARGSLYQLHQLARPVLVELPGLEPGFAVLDASGDRLEILASSGRMIIEREQLVRHWNGRYWDIWRMPGYVPTLMREGDRGPGVLWVKGAAAMAELPYGATVDDPYFGPSLKHWVENFQQQSGLRADGLIGPETLQVLSRYDRGAPR